MSSRGRLLRLPSLLTQVCLEGYELDAAAPGTCKSLPTDAPPALNRTGEIKLDMAREWEPRGLAGGRAEQAPRRPG